LLEFGHNVSYKILDRGLIEMLGPRGISSGLTSLSRTYSSHIATGYLYNSTMSILIFTTLLIIILKNPDLVGN
jgi:hypothetical protein